MSFPFTDQKSNRVEVKGWVAVQEGQRWGWAGWGGGRGVQREDYYGLGEINRVGFEQ